jgi:hypothetical protein
MASIETQLTELRARIEALEATVSTNSTLMAGAYLPAMILGTGRLGFTCLGMEYLILGTSKLDQAYLG